MKGNVGRQRDLNVQLLVFNAPVIKIKGHL